MFTSPLIPSLDPFPPPSHPNFARRNSHTDTSFYRAFNTGSPINVSAGNGSADLKHVVAHYEARNKATEEKRVARMKDGKVVSIYDDDRYI